MISDDFQKQVSSVQEPNQAESGLDSSLGTNREATGANRVEANGEADRPLEATMYFNLGISFCILLMDRQ